MADADEALDAWHAVDLDQFQMLRRRLHSCQHPEQEQLVVGVRLAPERHPRVFAEPLEPDRLDTWVKYREGLCGECNATCCTLPVEVRIDDLIRMRLVDEFEREEPAKRIAKRLEKDGVIEHFNHKREIFTLTRMANGDCLYLDRKTRLCTIYARRPDTCRNHPRIGPRPGHCAYRPK